MRRAALMVVVVVAFTAVVLVGRGGAPAGACSCAVIGVAEAIAAADVAFVGTVEDSAGPDAEGHYAWSFAVTEVVKGQAPAALTLRGEDWQVGCGTDFAQFGGPVVVVARRDGDELVAPGCTPVAPASELAALLAPLPEPNGTGPVAALVAHRHRWANLYALDARGRVLSWGDLDGHVETVASCPDSGLAAVRLWDHDGARVEVRIVDLATMRPVGERLGTGQPVVVDEMVCLPGADRPAVVTAAGGIDYDGRAWLHVVGGASAELTLDGVGDIVLDDGGTAYMVPSQAGGSVARYDLPDLRRAADLALAPDEAAVGAALDGDRLAVLVTERGADARYDSNATAVALIGVAAGELVRSATIPLPAGGPGAARAVTWLDDRTLAVERFTDRTKVLDVIDLDGRLVSSTDIGWGWGDAVLDGRLLRFRNGGLELIDRTGGATDLAPTPQQEDGGQSGFVAVVDHGPTIPARRPSAPVPRAPTDAGPWTGLVVAAGVGAAGGAPG